ncbi:anti-repressor SinI family protein [Salipaludibacillus sp. HK11]
MMLSSINDSVEKLDNEWVELIQKAYDMGIPIEKIREFLSKKAV